VGILRGDTGRARIVAFEHAGRAVAVFVPVAVAAIATGHSARLTGLITLLLGAAWYLSITVSFAVSKLPLTTIGPRVPVARGVFLGLLVSTTLGVWVPNVALAIWVSLVLAASIFVAVAAWETVVIRRFVASTRLLLVGPTDSCTNAVRELRGGNHGRFQLLGIVADDGSSNNGNASLVLGKTTDLQDIVYSVRPDLIALAPGCDRPATFARLIDSASAGFRVLELAQLYEYAFGRVPVRDLTRAWFMSILHLYQRPYSALSKRAADLVGALVLLVLTAPLFPILVLLVKTTRGPVILRQSRVGEHGRLFSLYKFRTMRQDAELPGEAVWAAENDPRVTTAGRLMRRFRLDELPQIWNVVKGEMSIVGPRPERPEFMEQLLESVPFWARRHLVKPGITGWAQVNRGYTADAEGSLDKLSYDLWYIRHRSMSVDLEICIRTLAAVLRGDSEPKHVAKEQGLEPLPDLLHLPQASTRNGTRDAEIPSSRNGTHDAEIPAVRNGTHDVETPSARNGTHEAEIPSARDAEIPAEA
jgi:exopolysaccharide biosynthesis polyprenyl glycosylphosphotransferase